MPFLHLAVTVRICKVGDCGLQTYQTVEKLKRATALDFTTIAPILYIHCYLPLLFTLFSCFMFSIVFGYLSRIEDNLV